MLESHQELCQPGRGRPVKNTNAHVSPSLQLEAGETFLVYGLWYVFFIFLGLSFITQSTTLWLVVAVWG